MLFRNKQITWLAQQVSTIERRLAELVDRQNQLHKVLAHQQAQAEQERTTLQETLTSLQAEIRELASLQRKQQETPTASDNETQTQLEQFRADLTACIERIQQIETSVAQVVTHLQALEDLALGWQQRVDTNRQQTKAASTNLEEEVQAREELTQETNSATHKATPRPRKSVKSNGATIHTQP
jgi:chromosome segregation ATPase